MRKYAAADWARLGQAVYEARNEAGMGKTMRWVDAVGRSSRTLLGLERGEPVGASTLEDIEKALGWQEGGTYRLMAGGVEDWRQLTVGSATQDDPGYVSAPGDKVDGDSEDRVLNAIVEMRQDMQAMEQRLSERLDRLEGGA